MNKQTTVILKVVSLLFAPDALGICLSHAANHERIGEGRNKRQASGDFKADFRSTWKAVMPDLIIFHFVLTAAIAVSAGVHLSVAKFPNLDDAQSRDEPDPCAGHRRIQDEGFEINPTLLNLT